MFRIKLVLLSRIFSVTLSKMRQISYTSIFFPARNLLKNVCFSDLLTLWTPHAGRGSHRCPSHPLVPGENLLECWPSSESLFSFFFFIKLWGDYKALLDKLSSEKGARTNQVKEDRKKVPAWKKKNVWSPRGELWLVELILSSVDRGRKPEQRNVQC